MRQLNNPVFAPDGFNGGQGARPRDAVADALSAIMSLAATSRRASQVPYADEGHGYDEGLVHEHGWARTNHK